MSRLAGRANPVVLLALAAAASAALLLALQSNLTFFLDDWDLLLHRRGFSADVLLRPHNEHIIVGPAIVYKTLQATFGMDSALPYQAVTVAVFVASVILLFVWLRRRVGDWFALLAAVSILFLGSAWEDLLSPFQIGYFGTMTFGLATLLALERRTRRADFAACLLLTGAVAFSSLGLAFIAGAAAAVATEGRLRSRAWVAAVPAVFFALWWIGWGHTAGTQVTFNSVAGAPRYVLEGISASIGSLLGLAPPGSGGPLGYGRLLLLVAVGAAAWRLWRLGSVPRWLWVGGAMTATFWLLAGMNAALFRTPTAPRYMYIGAIFFLLIGAELACGARADVAPRPRPRPRILVAAVVVVAVALASNLASLRDGYRIFKSTIDAERGGLTALEIARDHVSPGFLLTDRMVDAPFFDYVDAQSYLSAADAFGSPGYTEDQLRDAPERTREATDTALAAALELELTRSRATSGPGAQAPVAVLAEARPVPGRPSCLRAAPAQDSELAIIELPRGGGLIEAGARASVRLSARRFATDSFPVRLGTLSGGQRTVLEVPEDRAAQPWQLELQGREPSIVCGIAP